MFIRPPAKLPSFSDLLRVSKQVKISIICWLILISTENHQGHFSSSLIRTRLIAMLSHECLLQFGVYQRNYPSLCLARVQLTHFINKPSGSRSTGYTQYPVEFPTNDSSTVISSTMIRMRAVHNVAVATYGKR